jgi:hypothetical protein
MFFTWSSVCPPCIFWTNGRKAEMLIIMRWCAEWVWVKVTLSHWLCMYFKMSCLFCIFWTKRRKWELFGKNVTQIIWSMHSLPGLGFLRSKSVLIWDNLILYMYILHIKTHLIFLCNFKMLRAHICLVDLNHITDNIHAHWDNIGPTLQVTWFIGPNVPGVT